MIDNQKFLIILQLIYMSWHGHGLLFGFRLIFGLFSGLDMANQVFLVAKSDRMPVPNVQYAKIWTG